MDITNFSKILSSSGLTVYDLGSVLIYAFLIVYNKIGFKFVAYIQVKTLYLVTIVWNQLVSHMFNLRSQGH